MNEPIDPLLDEDMFDYCEHCGMSKEWEECASCGGEGYFDWDTLQFEDPLWYSPGDTETCPECHGKGGWSFCVNKNCKEPTP